MAIQAILQKSHVTVSLRVSDIAIIRNGTQATHYQKLWKYFTCCID